MMEKKKLNILYLNHCNEYTNFYGSIKDCKFCKVVYRYSFEDLSLESYDAFIVSVDIFLYDEGLAEKTLERIINYKKPIIIVYSSDFNSDYKGLVYLKEKFGIDFERKDAAIIEDDYYGYLPETDNGFALSMHSKNGIGKAYIKNTKNCFILKFDNVSVIHDNKAFFLNRGQGIYQQNPNLLHNLLNEENNQSIPDWVKSIRVFDDKIILKDISEISESIKKLLKEKEELEEKRKNNDEYKKVLYTSGDELVEITKKILVEMLGISIQDLDIKKEDLSFSIGQKKILVEIKGVNTSIKREYVSQTQRHIEDNAKTNNIDDDEIANKYKGLLIITPYIKLDIQERKQREFYSQSVIGDIKHYNICAIDTITLLGMFHKFRAGEKINLKDIILNNNYIQPDFSILQDNNE